MASVKKCDECDQVGGPMYHLEQDEGMRTVSDSPEGLDFCDLICLASWVEYRRFH